MNTQPPHQALSADYHTTGALQVARAHFTRPLPDWQYMVLTWPVLLKYENSSTPLIVSIADGLPTLKADIRHLLQLPFLPDLIVEFGLTTYQVSLSVGNISAILRFMRARGGWDALRVQGPPIVNDLDNHNQWWGGLSFCHYWIYLSWILRTVSNKNVTSFDAVFCNDKRELSLA